jgi:hypothetical protein
MGKPEEVPKLPELDLLDHLVTKPLKRRLALGRPLVPNCLPSGESREPFRWTAKLSGPCGRAAAAARTARLANADPFDASSGPRNERGLAVSDSAAAV